MDNCNINNAVITKLAIIENTFITLISLFSNLGKKLITVNIIVNKHKLNSMSSDIKLIHNVINNHIKFGNYI